jgi:hypothetical protein
VEEKFRVRRHRIQIQRQTTIPPLNWAVWTRVCEIWGEIHDDMITIRYQKNLFPGMRVLIGNHHHYEIVGVIDRPGKTRLVELHVKELRASADMPDAQQR